MSRLEEHGRTMATVRDFESPAFRALVKRADVILGTDRNDPSHEALFYGRAVLQRIVKERKEIVLSILRVEIDFSTDDIEYLCAAVTALKGRLDYESFHDAIAKGN